MASASHLSRTALLANRIALGTIATFIGTGCLLTEMLVFTAYNIVVRLSAASSALPVLLFLVYLFSFLYALLAALTNSRSRGQLASILVSPRRTRLNRYCARAIVGYVSLLAWYYAIAILPLATATALFFMRAFFIDILARWPLREHVDFRQWGALCLGFVGVLIVLDPQRTGVSVLGTSLALFSALTSAITALQNKKLSMQDPPLLATVQMLALMTPIAAVAALADWRPPDGAQITSALVIAGLLAIGQVIMIKGYSLVRMSYAAGLESIRLLLASLAGALFFAEPVQLLTVVGGSLILGAALLSTVIERKAGHPA